jgi:hypothetical protein
VSRQSLRAQLQRNLDAMARELQRNPEADQSEWEHHIADAFGLEVTQIVTSPDSGAKNCHQFSSVESTTSKNCHFEVTRNVTGRTSNSGNLAN